MNNEAEPILKVKGNRLTVDNFNTSDKLGKKLQKYLDIKNNNCRHKFTLYNNV